MPTLITRPSQSNDNTSSSNNIQSNANETTPATHDVILSILTSHNNLNKQVKFVNAIPTSLGGVEFSTQLDAIDYLQATITFRYDRFEIIR